LETQAESHGHGGPALTRRLSVPVLVAVTLLGVIGSPVSALGSVHIAISVQARPQPSQPTVRSITVSPTSLRYGPCQGGTSHGSVLGFPNGACAGLAVTVTNTGSTTRIGVLATVATPSGGGTAWTLCGAPVGPPCAGSLPGVDQFVQRVKGPNGSLILALSLQCDATVGTRCQLAAGVSVAQSLSIIGPSSSSNAKATTYSTSITWEAIP
jgi:hypothetical protein